MPRLPRLLTFTFALACLLGAFAWALQTDPLRPDHVGPGATLGMAPPPGAINLTPGDMSAWMGDNGSPAAWQVEDGVMVAGGGNIFSREEFADCLLHVEFCEPDMPQASGQAKGNSGVYLQARYEIQVLDCYGYSKLGTGDCGAIYGTHAPLFAACRPPLEWQSYDIVFRAPRYDENGGVRELVRMTVLMNGLPIHNNVEVPGATVAAAFQDHVASGPIMLQDHGCPVRYRNIWALPMPEQGIGDYQGS